MDNELTPPEQRGFRRPTYGELRRQLAENGNPWLVDPLISDDEVLPEYPLGGLPEGSPQETSINAVDPAVDVRDVIADLPPNDPWLRRSWIDAGISVDQIPPALTGDLDNDKATTFDAEPGGSR